ncbi:hypothetical protein J2X66_004381 [Pseudomonas sp. 3296]|uniref:hypothetical protein n=1 Tax=Pseudomonas sp. 3296 TaxID=2817753 RepID=UPI0028583CB9|nr:hypothetical protein [Pseudomonas sp. 3296]MDR6917502.1 hypothetical protein [Pseudomonas sp. 3296]
MIKMFSGYWAQRFADEIAAGRTEEQILNEVEMLNLLRNATGPVDLSLCASMPNLRDLYICLPEAAVSGKEAIAKIPRLRKLVIAGDNFGPEDFEAIACNPELAELTINAMEISSFNALATAPKLKHLSLNNVTGSTAEAVAVLGTLTQLRISQTELGSLSPLAAMPRLRSLELKEIKLANVSFLAAPKLVSFTSDVLAVDESGLGILAKKMQLTTFDYPVSDLSVLVHCTRLTSIRVNATANLDFPVIAHLPITSIDVYFATSETQAENILERARAIWPGLRATGYRQDWSIPKPTGPHNLTCEPLRKNSSFLKRLFGWRDS